MAYELIAAIMGILQFQQLGHEGVGGRRFIDSNPARQCVDKASSKQPDLNQLTGMLWYTAGKMLKRYWCQYVSSSANLADAPSRGNFSIVTQLGARIIHTNFGECTLAVESWMSIMDLAALVV